MREPRAWPAIACGAAVALAGAAAASTQIRANDLWWHLKTGEWIAVNGAVPRVDPFSFTSAGTPWVDHGWLWELAAWSLHALAGLEGLAFLKLSCAAAAALAGFSALRRAGWSLHPASLFVLLSLAGLRFRLTDRPDTASLAFLAVFTWVLVIAEMAPARRAAASFCLCALWANVHAGVLLAPALAAAVFLASLIEVSRALASRLPGSAALIERARGEGLAAASSLAGLLINPYGYRLVLVPFKLGRALADPRLVNPEWLPPTWRAFPFFHAALSAGIVFCAFGILRRRDASQWRPLLVISGAGALAVTGVRHIGVFFTLLPFAAALAWRPGGRRAEFAPAAAGGLKGSSVERWAPLWGILAAALYPILPSPLTAPSGFGIEPDRFPISEVDYIERKLPAPRFLYNDVGHGGYLIWRFYPEDRVFIDGRNEVHASLLGEIAPALDDGLAWTHLLDRYGIRAALVRYRDERIRVAGTPAEERSFAALHFPKSRWALVHWGDAAMVFVKRGGEGDALIAREEYRYIHPEDWEYQVERCRAGDADLLRGILADLRRRLDEPPRSFRAADLLRNLEPLAHR